MFSTAQPSKPKRRWCRFSLKTLLVVIAVSCVGFAWTGERMQRARENRARVAAVQKAVAAIEKLGLGSDPARDNRITNFRPSFLNDLSPRLQVFSNYEELRSQTWLEKQFDDPGYPGDPVRVLHVKFVNLVLSDATGADLERLDTLVRFASLDINGTNLTHAELGNLRGAANRARMNRERRAATERGVAMVAIYKLGGEVTSAVKVLRSQTWSEILFEDPGGEDDPVYVVDGTGTYVNLDNTGVTDSGLEQLKALKLCSLVLSGTSITDDGLKHLEGLNTLHSLQLRNTSITDAGLEHLKALTKLQILDLIGTKVTDAGLERLQEMTMLADVYLVDTKVTDKGVEKLQQALPGCQIIR